MTGHYLGYLEERPDQVTGALRDIATAAGAAIVHCAAGKDRTGVIVALALTAAGWNPDAIVADYVATDDRIEAILDRLRRSRTYAKDLSERPVTGPPAARRRRCRRSSSSWTSGTAALPRWLADQRLRRRRVQPAPRQAQGATDPMIRACLVDVYDTIVTSAFESRQRDVAAFAGRGRRSLAGGVADDPNRT